MRIIEKCVEPVTGALVLIISLYILLWPVKLTGMGMESAINDGDWVFSSRFATMLSEPKKGDIVSFTVKNAKKPLVKRVIAVSGDEVEISEGLIYINGEELEEKYAEGAITGSYKAVIEEGFIYALGDNRSIVADSRIYGQVPAKDIKSKILFKFYPLNKITAFF